MTDYGRLTRLDGFTEPVYYCYKTDGNLIDKDFLVDYSKHFVLGSHNHACEINDALSLLKESDIQTSMPSFGDRLLIHPRSRVPITLLKKYEIVLDRSECGPDKIVVPKEAGLFKSFTADLPNTLFATACHLFRDMYSDALLVVDFPYTYYRGDVDWEVFTEVLNRDMDDSKLTGHRWEPVDHDYYDLRHTKAVDDLGLYILDAPKEKLCNDTDLFIGDEALTEDMMLSCYAMSKSPDKQIVETAYLTMAQYDWHDYKEFIGWLLDKGDSATVMGLKKRNGAFAWLCNNLDGYKYRRHQHWTGQKSINLAKQVIVQETGCMLSDGVLVAPYGSEIANICSNVDRRLSWLYNNVK